MPTKSKNGHGAKIPVSAGRPISHVSDRAMPEKVEPVAWDPKFTSLHEEAYGVLMDLILSQPLVVDDEELIGLINASRDQRYAAIDKWLSNRFSQIKKHWKRILEIPHHRVADISRRRLYWAAANLREDKGLSWARLARRMDPNGYRKDARATIERLRKGVGTVQKKKSSDEAPFNPMYYIPFVFSTRRLAPPILKDSVIPSPKWARKRLQIIRRQYEHLIKRAGLRPEVILQKAQLDYIRWVDYVSELGSPRKRKLKERIRNERFMVYYCLLSLTEDLPKDDVEKLRLCKEELRKLTYFLLSFTGDLKIPRPAASS